MLVAATFLLGLHQRDAIHIGASFKTFDPDKLRIELVEPGGVSGSGGWQIDATKVNFRVIESPPGTTPSLKFAGAFTTLSPIPFRDVRILKMPIQFNRGGTQAGWYALAANFTTAVISDHPADTSMRDPDPLRFYLSPSATADNIGAIRKKWVGRQVWIFGAAASGPGEQSFVWSPLQPVTITDVRRIRDGRISTIHPVPEWPVYNEWYPGAFQAQDPIRVRFTIPVGSNHQSAGVTEYGPEFQPPFGDHGSRDFGAGATNGKHVSYGEVILADEWELPLVMTSVPPTSLLNGASSRIRRAFAKRHVVRGMSRGLVVRLIGYPHLDQPSASQVTQKRWSYSGSAPFSYDVTFTADNRVESAKVEGTLP